MLQNYYRHLENFVRAQHTEQLFSLTKIIYHKVTLLQCLCNSFEAKDLQSRRVIKM